MVKNTSGGTKTKGLARKHVKSAGGGAALRLPEEQLETIVAVGSMLGNGMCEVFNNDDERFIAHIRNKFKGRHKRANLITKNSIILCGYREWEKPYKNLDVIFIYDDHNINQLRENPTINITNICKRISNNTYHHDHDLNNHFVFTDDTEQIALNADANNTNTNTNYNIKDIDIDITDI
tara:strand:+ start:1106 stop:1642 length:537 start_codon:yes stop_codon:yes gene_type:complete